MSYVRFFFSVALLSGALYNAEYALAFFGPLGTAVFFGCLLLMTLAAVWDVLPVPPTEID